MGELLDAHERYLEAKGARIYKIRSQLRPVRRILGGHAAERLTAGDVEGYRLERSREASKRGGPVSQATINRELTHLRAALRRAVEDDLLPKCPRFRMRKETTIRADWWSPEDVARVAQELEAAGHGCLADLARFYFLTGWRKNEALGLTWQEIDWARGVAILSADRSKNREARVLPLVGPVRELLERRRRQLAQGSPYVFHRDGERRGDFKRAWETAKKRAGVDPALTIHGMRRSFARHQLVAGVPMSVTMRLGGWKREEMLRRYQQIDDPILEQGMAQMVEYLNRAESPNGQSGKGGPRGVAGK